MSEPIIKCEKCKSCDAILFAGAECYTCKIKHLERQLEEAREREVVFLNSLIWDMAPSGPIYKAISKRIEELTEKGDE